MPLYTYVMSYKGTTRIAQHRSSNYTGFLREPIIAAYPELEPHLGTLIRMRPEPIPKVEHAWRCSAPVSGSDFTLHVIETRK